jgi:hypothetical protein
MQDGYKQSVNVVLFNKMSQLSISYVAEIRSVDFGASDHVVAQDRQ